MPPALSIANESIFQRLRLSVAIGFGIQRKKVLLTQIRL
jgi:hypothetical protein